MNADTEWFDIGPGVLRAVRTRPYQREKGDPLWRPLKIFTFDPSTPRVNGAVDTVNVPYEPLKIGPTGSMFRVAGIKHASTEKEYHVDLDDHKILLGNGKEPSPSDPEFSQQMVYGVSNLIYSAFQRALGRDLAWGFDARLHESEDGLTRLVLRPNATTDRNAYYDKNLGEICFGSFTADNKVVGPNLPGGTIHTCLSHEIVAHEVTHALLDGLREKFDYPSGADVLAFHEGFADLIAILQRFTYRNVVLSALREAEGDLAKANLLADIGQQFGQTTGLSGALRSAMVGEVKTYDPTLKPHDLGLVLVQAIFEALVIVYRRRTERYFRFYKEVAGQVLDRSIPFALLELLVDEVIKIAGQFLNICIRAIDYCPPVDIELGEFLRAAITADYDLVPDDAWDYRGAWILAFSRRRIYPTWVNSLATDELLWRPPTTNIPPVTGLSFAKLQFSGDPSHAAGAQELCRQAKILGQLATCPALLNEFGLANPSETELDGDVFEKPRIESIRSARRVGPDGIVVFDTVAEIIQRRIVRGNGCTLPFDFYGGATVIIGPDGAIRYVIRKRINDDDRLSRQKKFIASSLGRRYWNIVKGRCEPRRQLFRMIHKSRNSSSQTDPDIHHI